MASKKAFISQKNQKFRMEFADNHLQKGSEFWKTVLFADETNIMYLDETEVIMCGEKTWERTWEKISSFGQI
jgi:hypothetical protein